MKNILFITAILFAIIFNNSSIEAQTSVKSGNWSDPTTWGGTPPTGSGDVVINHDVVLDIDYSHSSGSITINSSGSLSGNSNERIFSLNFPSGTASLTINGKLNVARLAFISGTITNSNLIETDSLLNSADIINNNNSTINAVQFMNDTAGSIVNNGTISSTNFLNIDTVTNNDTLKTNDFANSKTFTNEAGAYILITNNFSNKDTLGVSPAILINNGWITVQNDWYNGEQIKGSGQFCIANNTYNEGTMSGTFDFCDQTGHSIDLNTGTIDATITFCQNSCSTNIIDNKEITNYIIRPNPIKNSAIIETDQKFENAHFIIFNNLGQKVKNYSNINGKQFQFDRQNLSKGIYFFKITNKEQEISGKFIVE